MDPYSPNVGRQQVVVVVREDWTVSCYDISLKLLWEKAVAHKSHEMASMAEYFHIDEVAVYLAPLGLEEGSSGAVIVGASMVPRDVEKFENRIRVEQGLGIGEKGGLQEHPDMQMRAKLEHFSLYALDSKDGHVIWRHDGSEVKAEQYVRSLPQHAYKLDVNELAVKQHHGGGLNDWMLFRQSLIGELPHRWTSRDDTGLRIAHFVRRHLGAGAAHGSAFAHDNGEFQHCTVMVVSGLPARSQLFNGSLCLRRHHLNDPLHHGTGSANFVGGSNAIPVAIAAAAPVVMRTLDSKTMKESSAKDLVVAIHSGIVTAFTGRRGVTHWQINGAPNWDIKFRHAYSLQYDTDAFRVEEVG